MRLITRARYALARWALKSMQWQYTPSWVSRSMLNGAFQSLVNQGYKRSAAYFACVETHAFTFPEPPLWVWDGEDDNARPIPNHPIRRLMLRPNPDQDEVAFKAQVITWAAVGGNCYIYKLRNRSRQVILLRWLSALVGGAFALLLLAVRWLWPSLARQMDRDDTDAPGGTP